MSRTVLFVGGPKDGEEWVITDEIFNAGLLKVPFTWGRTALFDAALGADTKVQYEVEDYTPHPKLPMVWLASDVRGTLAREQKKYNRNGDSK